MPSIPTLWPATHGCRATVSITSYPSRLWSGSKKSNAPPEHPVPRMFTSTTAKPIRLAMTEIPFWGPDGSAYP